MIRQHLIGRPLVRRLNQAFRDAGMSLSNALFLLAGGWSGTKGGEQPSKGGNPRTVTRGTKSPPVQVMKGGHAAVESVVRAAQIIDAAILPSIQGSEPSSTYAPTTYYLPFLYTNYLVITSHADISLSPNLVTTTIATPLRMGTERRTLFLPPSSPATVRIAVGWLAVALAYQLALHSTAGN